MEQEIDLRFSMNTNHPPEYYAERMNYHGALFKKAMIKRIASAKLGFSVFQEEFPVTFGSPTAIDFVIFQDTVPKLNIFIIECKRVFTSEWLFIRDTGSKYRKCRIVENGVDEIIDIRNELNLVDICTDGYEILSKERSMHDGNSGRRITSDPIYQAANQLCQGYLGMIGGRIPSVGQPMWNKKMESFYPVLLTTAQLLMFECNADDISLVDGRISIDKTKSTPVKWLILNHPFGTTSEASGSEFRVSNSGKNWDISKKESIYVVNSAAFEEFLASGVWA